ncbi:MAG: chorismate pyruvate-lyase family protein [Proteobacteria bacterium]|nr:chorismate pyruvate-lyase family protein [Pseudomonadota bacterium]
MLDLSSYPQSLQLLMQTDGTVTELIKLLAGEDMAVIKVLEQIEQPNSQRILHRHIYLQGKQSKNNWLYAESEIYLDNLAESFVTDLLEKTIPIGTLWINYQMETFKQPISQCTENVDDDASKFTQGIELLVRVYQVFNQQKCIMQITEKFPVNQY